MAKRGDAAVLRHVVIFLRSHAQRTQAQFGKECRVDQAEISRYELGHLAPSEEALRRMAKVARIAWPLVVHLRQSYTSVLASGARPIPALPGGALDLTILQPALLAVTPYLIEPYTRVMPLLSPEQQLREAAEIWAALERHPVQFCSRLIQLSPRSGDWALAVQVCAASVKRATHSAEEALELAGLALSIAERSPKEESWRSRLKGYCWAHVANARRVANDLAGSDEAFTRAWDLWCGANPPELELLAEWRLFSLEASLRRSQLRFSAALELLDRAQTASRDSQEATARILLKKGNVLEQMGDSESALAALREAAPFVETSGDPRLAFGLRFDTANNLYLLSRYREAAELMPKVREWAVQQGNDLDLTRVLWLEARVAAGEGRTEEAIACLEQVRRAFTLRELAYDAALSSLDLAVLWLKTGNTAEVRELAVSMGWIFKAKGIDREALMALKLFCDAARQESATVELARHAVAEIERVRCRGK